MFFFATEIWSPKLVLSKYSRLQNLPGTLAKIYEYHKLRCM